MSMCEISVQSRLLAAQLMLILVISLASCGSGRYDSKERDQVESFIRASELFLAAGDDRKAVFAEYQPERVRSGTITDDQLQKFIQKLHAAKSEVEKVSPEVPTKIHPDLPEAFEKKMRASLANQIIGYTSNNMEERIQAQVIGVSLHNEWIRWWNNHDQGFQTK